MCAPQGRALLPGLGVCTARDTAAGPAVICRGVGEPLGRLLQLLSLDTGSVAAPFSVPCSAMLASVAQTLSHVPQQGLQLMRCGAPTEPGLRAHTPYISPVYADLGATGLLAGGQCPAHFFLALLALAEAQPIAMLHTAVNHIDAGPEPHPLSNSLLPTAA